MKLILASSSPRRIELLKEAGFDFEVRVSAADENAVCAKDADKLALMRARLKAESVADELLMYGEEFIVLGADTVVERSGEIFPKPANERDAIGMLKRLSDGDHNVFTGVCLVSSDNRTEERAVCTAVGFGAFDLGRIEAYVKSGKAFGKAGAYGIQDEELSFLIKKTDGARDNVIGLPVATVTEMLKEKSKWRQWK